MAVTITYHREADAWWAESEYLPGFSALAHSFTDLKSLVAEYLVANKLVNTPVVEVFEGAILGGTPVEPVKAGVEWWKISEKNALGVALGRPTYGANATTGKLISA